MGRKIQIKRGLEQYLPTLELAELGFTTDTEKLIIGGVNGNVDVTGGGTIETHTHDNKTVLDNITGTAGVQYDLDDFYKLNLSQLTNFVPTSRNDGSGIDLTWGNSTSDFYIKTIIFSSESNIIESTYEYCVANATKIIDSNSLTAYDDAAHARGITVYYKGFMLFDVIGETKANEGIGVSCVVLDTVPPDPITDFAVVPGDASAVLTWTNPATADFNKTKILYRTDGYPTGVSDGTVAYEGSGNTVSLTGLTNGTTYYFRSFTYDSTGNINSVTTGQQATAVPSSVKIYGVSIDLTNSNPLTSVTYTDDAAGLTKGSSSWDSLPIFKDIKPCVLLNGVVQYYLMPTDFTKKADGTASDITSGTAGDVMIEIPKVGYQITTVGNTLTVKITDKADDANFKYYAHTRTTEGDRNKLYVGAYLGYYDGSKLRSLSGKTPTATQTIGTFRTQAQANGTGYSQLSFYPLTLLQCLYLIKYGSLDSQTALGRGFVDGNSAAIATGGTNAKGMYFGETTGKLQMKFAGIEDFWGNLLWWIDGLYSDASRNILTAFTSFNDTGSGYTNRGQGATADIGGYMNAPQGTNTGGFIAKSVTGSATTYFSDYATLSAGYLPVFGGGWGYASGAGVFYLQVNCGAADSYGSLGGRLLYL